MRKVLFHTLAANIYFHCRFRDSRNKCTPKQRSWCLVRSQVSLGSPLRNHDQFGIAHLTGRQPQL